MSILTEQEIDDLYYTELDRRELSFARAIEDKVIEKIKAQGPAATYVGFTDTTGAVYRQETEVPCGTKLYKLPEGD